MGGSTGLRVLSVAAALWLGCSGPDADEPDGAPDAGPDAAPPDAGGFVPDPPAPPAPAMPAAEVALPDLGPCAPGWRAVGADPTICDPWPEGGRREDCAAGEAHLPGGAGCERIGSACPVGDWPEDLPAEGPLRVRPGAEPGGDGSALRPFATIADALAVATPGAVVALARGTYDETVAPSVAVTLRGACAAETILAPTAPHDSEATLRTTSVALVVQDLRISGERPGLTDGVIYRDNGRNLDSANLPVPDAVP